MPISSAFTIPYPPGAAVNSDPGADCYGHIWLSSRTEIRKTVMAAAAAEAECERSSFTKAFTRVRRCSCVSNCRDSETADDSRGDSAHSFSLSPPLSPPLCLSLPLSISLSVFRSRLCRTCARYGLVFCAIYTYKKRFLAGY